MKLFYTLLLLWLSMAVSVVNAQVIDPTFSPFFDSYAEGFDVAVAPSGKIVVATHTTTFGEHPSPGIARLLPDGTDDPEFVPDPTVTGRVERIAIQDNGKMIIAGYFKIAGQTNTFQLLRLLENGSLDPAYQPLLSNDRTIEELTVLPDQTIYLSYRRCVPEVTGSCLAFGIMLFAPDGTADPNLPEIEFTPNHLSGSASRINAIGFQSSNELLVFGNTLELNGQIQSVFRIDRNGVIDPAYDPTDEEIMDAAVSATGEATLLYDLGQSLLKVAADGSPIGPSQEFIGSYNGLAYGPGGEVMLAGNDLAVLYPNNFLNSVPNVLGPNASLEGIAHQGAENFLIVGRFGYYQGFEAAGIVSLNSNTLGRNVNFQGVLKGVASITSALLQSDGKIIIVGNFKFINGIAADKLARLHPDGTLDQTFSNSAIGQDHFVMDMGQLPSGNLVVSGYYSANTPPNQFNGLAILGPNGNFITNVDFPYQASMAAALGYLEVGEGGKVYVGDITVFNSGEISSQRTMLYDFESPFDYSSVNLNELYIDQVRYINNLQTDADGKLLIHGSEIAYDGGPSRGLVRTLTNGQRDPNFDAPATEAATIRHLSILPDGLYLAAGHFGSAFSADSPALLLLDQDGALVEDLSTAVNGPTGPTNPNARVFKLPGGSSLLSGQINSYQGEAISTAKVSLDQSGNIVGEFLPEVPAFVCNGTKLIDENSAYVYGNIVNPQGGGGIVRVLFNPSSSVSRQTDRANPLQVFPNPVAGQKLTFEWPVNNGDSGQRAVFQILSSATGQRMQSGVVALMAQSNIKLANLPAGHYQLVLEIDGRRFISPFVTE